MTVRAVFTLCAVVATMAGVPSLAQQTIEGYSDRTSYQPGDTIVFHVSTTSPTYRLDFRRDHFSPVPVASIPGIPGSFHPTPADGWRGAHWPASYSFVIPAEWEPGSYFVWFRTEEGPKAAHPFVVRPTVPGSRSNVAFVTNFNTRSAYDYWGGKSLYTSNVEGDPEHAVQVSILRPWARGEGRGLGYYRQRDMYATLEDEGLVLEYITERDIDADPNLLLAYDVVILTYHFEYLTREILDALQAHHDRGGHLAFFSGNDMWWQVRYEDNRNTMVGYRGYWQDDPMLGVQDDLVTYLWGSELLNRPGEALKGIAYQHYSWMFEPAEFIVQDSTHWAFEGTGLQNGDALGIGLANGETDYLEIHSPAVMDVLLTARRDTPSAGLVPGVAFVDAATVYYEDTAAYGFPDGHGGSVFAGGATWWSEGMRQGGPKSSDQVVKVTGNVIRHLSASPRPTVVSGEAFLLQLQHGTGGEILFTWDDSCLSTDVDYAIYEGSLGNFTSHSPLTCTTGGALSYSDTPATGDTYYLVVPRSAGVEGSYGTDGSGGERPQGTRACVAQVVGACP